MFTLQPPRHIPTLPFATDATGLACRFMSASVRSDRSPALPRNDAKCQTETFPIPHAVGRSSLDFGPREFSGVPLDEVVHADRPLAYKLEQVVGHAVVAALLV